MCATLVSWMREQFMAQFGAVAAEKNCLAAEAHLDDQSRRSGFRPHEVLLACMLAWGIPRMCASSGRVRGLSSINFSLDTTNILGRLKQYAATALIVHELLELSVRKNYSEFEAFQHAMWRDFSDNPRILPMFYHWDFWVMKIFETALFLQFKLNKHTLAICFSL